MSGEIKPGQMLHNGRGDAPVVLILAHGAGAAMDTPFMEAFATGAAQAGIRCVRFEFPYMAARRRDGRRRPPDREPVLRNTWHEAIDRVLQWMQPTQQLVIGGKSLGGRIASLVAAEQQPRASNPVAIAGLVCLGYPFHPASKPDRLRIEHLAQLATPTLIVQGERDSFGNRDEVAHYSLSPHVRIHWLPDGDHSFKPRKASGRTEAQNWYDGIRAMVAFCESLPAN